MKKINYAVILSGGSGKRFMSSVPKQFLVVAGKTILEYCIEKFNYNLAIDKIIIVSNSDYTEQTKQIVEKRNFDKVMAVVNGGAFRGESSFAGICEIYRREKDPDNVNVLIHDAARPNVADSIIKDVISMLDTHKAVSVALKNTDTIYIVDNNSVISQIPDRNKILRVQTPQAFNLSLIFAAYQNAKIDEKFKYTDDCCLIFNTFPNEKIAIVEGSPDNIKITYSLDLETFERMISNNI